MPVQKRDVDGRYSGVWLCFRYYRIVIPSSTEWYSWIECLFLQSIVRSVRTGIRKSYFTILDWARQTVQYITMPLQHSFRSECSRRIFVLCAIFKFSRGQFFNGSLTIGGYSGNSADAMAWHNGRQFSTYDHDTSPGGCTKQWWGAFWYNTCYYAGIPTSPASAFRWYAPSWSNSWQLSSVEVRLLC